jgi:hypothetical protein
MVSYKRKYRKYFLGKFNFFSQLVVSEAGVWRKGQSNAGFGWGNLRERDHSEDPDVDGKIILRWIFRRWDKGVDCIDPTRNRDR